jgi:hypothetical protein
MADFFHRTPLVTRVETTLLGGFILCVFCALGVPAGADDSPDPFAFFKPTVVLSSGDRRQLQNGQPITHVIQGSEREVAVFAAMKTTIDGERLLAWVNRIEALKKNPYVLAIGRMSPAPRVEDLNGLTIEDDEAADLLDCEPGDCSMKLSSGEMRALQQAARGKSSDVDAVQDAFRRTVLSRITNYLTSGVGGLPPDESEPQPVKPAEVLSNLLKHSPFLSTHAPAFADYLVQFPRKPIANVDSFVYWSKERIAGKPIVSATHVSSLRGEHPGVPEGLAATIGIFSTHYVNGSLGVMAVVRERPGAEGYLVYVNRSQVDVLGGMFGGLMRMVVQRRLRSEAQKIGH